MVAQPPWETNVREMAGEEKTELVEVVLSHPVSLSCESNAIPLPQISWYHNGKELSNSDGVVLLPGGSVLQIPVVREEDAGRYTCQAVNEAGADRMHYELVVLVPPVIQGKTLHLVEEVEVLVNGTLELRCEVSGNPSPSISWLKDGRALHNSLRHHISEKGKMLVVSMVQLGDMAGYTCVAENKAGSAERLYRVSVQAPPKIMGERHDKVSVIVGHMASLTCDVQAYPAPEITWYRDGNLLEFSSDLLVLPDPPTLKQRPGIDQDHMTLRAGSLVSFYCDAEGEPKPEVTWYRNGVQLSTGGGLQIHQHGLEIERVKSSVNNEVQITKATSSPDGMFPFKPDASRCICVNVLKQMSEKGGTKSGPLQQNITGTLGSIVLLHCEATGIPSPVISWLKDGTSIETRASSVSSSSSRVEIGPLRLLDTGIYICLARNAEGEARTLYSLTVQVPPSITGSGLLSEVSLSKGNQLTLECVASGIPKPELTWLKDGKLLDLSDTQHLTLSLDRSRLHFHLLRPHDSGTYSCLAENAAGRETKVHAVTVMEPPSIPNQSASPSNVTVNQDGVITLECQAVGSPPPHLSWLKNGMPLVLSPRTRVLTSGKMLRISQAQVTDSGIYTCVATSAAGTAERSYSLQVQEPPGVDRTEPSEQVTVIRGSAVTFTCEARGFPLPRLSWFKDGQSLSLHSNLLSDGLETRLRLPDVTTTDSGQYTCVASNQAGRSTKHFNLTVLEPPKISADGSPERVSLAVNNALELECTAFGIPPPRITWLKDGRPLDREGGLLRIEQVQVKDAGLYTCLASSAAGEDGKNHWVHVQVPPNILGSADSKPVTKPVTIVANRQLTLECRSDGEPPPSIEWFKDNNRILMDSRIQTLAGGQYLDIQEVSPSDSGEYSCVVTNIAGSSSLIFHVVVYITPVIKAGTSLVTAVVSQPALLPCVAEGLPAPTISWRKDGGLISLEGTRFDLLPDGSLRIKEVQLLDVGRYYCTASNAAGSAHNGVDLRVYGTYKIITSTHPVSPSILSGPVNVTLTANLRSPLSCEATGMPRPQVTWKKNGIPLDFSPYQNKYRLLASGSLIITSPTIEDEGVFECTATNEAGEERRTIDVSVQVPPTIIDDSPDITVTKMAAVVLPCYATGQPEPVVTWTMGGGRLGNRGADYRVLPTGALEITAALPSHAGRYTCSARNPAGLAFKHITLSVLGPRLAVLPNGALRISRVTSDDAGTYLCIAQNEAGKTLGETRLTVQVPPVLRASNQERTAVLNQSVSLVCEVEGQPKIEISWLKDGRPIRDGGRLKVLPNGTIWIQPTQRGDAGRYTCSAVNAAGMSSLDIRLVIHVPPLIVTDRTELSVIEGYQALLPCAAQGFPEMRISWEKGGSVVRDLPGKFTRLRSGQLVVEHAEADDAGLYTCVAENVAGTARRDIRLSVHVRPTFIELPGDVTLNTGQRLTLSCLAGGTPTPAVSWTVNNKPIPAAESHQGGQSSLVIENASKEDAGTYICKAENVAGVIKAISFVRIREPPILVGTSHVLQTEPLGRTLMLHCAVRGDPTPQIRWHKDGHLLTTSHRLWQLQNGSLTIYNTGSGDDGEYKCVAENEGGVAERTVILKVQSGYSDWTAWGPCSASCGQGVQERTRLCNNPIPSNGGRPCEGKDTETRMCHSKLCPGSVPTRARVSMIGMINEREFGVAFLSANISEDPEAGISTVRASINNIPPSVGPLMPVLLTVLAPVYWTTVFQAGDVRNGFSLTKGFFRQESQVEFGTGEILKLTHVARGLDSDGVLLVDVVLNGFVSETLSDANLALQEFSESYTQTGSGQLYAWSTQRLLLDRSFLSLRCNHSIIFEESVGLRGPLLQTLRVRSISANYHRQSQEVHFQFSTSLHVPDGRGDQCPDGFVLDSASYCSDINECEESSISPCHQRCLNTLGSFRCACNAGYQLVGKRCIDIDECTMNSCPAHKRCQNTEGGYQCLDSCTAGMTPAENGACVDIDECKDGSHHCRYNQVCENSIGGYRCTCPRGYRSQGVGRPCLDIDECQQLPKPCAHQCQNIPGSYRCLCPPGTALLGDGRSCAGLERVPAGSNSSTGVLTRLRPQLVSSHGGPLFTSLLFQPNGQDLLEGRRRTCPLGYTERGGVCVDIDECLEQDVRCGPNQMCFNTRGSYQCLDTPCPATYQKGSSPGTCFRPCTLDCAKDGPMTLQYKLLTLPLGVPANHNVIRLSAFSEAGLLQERTTFQILEQDGHGVGGALFGIRDEAGRGIIYTLRLLQTAGLAQLRVQATTHSDGGQVKYQSVFVIYIAISHYPY
ncbi:HMCN2 protein, partial [Polypterus senegalus]